MAALNPHGSDGGLLGDEEENEIRPAVEAAQEMGINASGPVPADIIFVQAINGSYDVVLATLGAFSEDICRNCIGLSGAQTKVVKGLKKVRMDLEKSSIPEMEKG